MKIGIVERVVVSLAAAAMAIGLAVAGCSTTNNLNNGGGASAQGQSCTKTFDCATDLVCLANICLPAPTTAATGDGGSPDGSDGGPTSTGTSQLGQLHESCQRSSDCAAPLVCLNDSCALSTYGLTTTGKTCAGQCNTAADCFELPPQVGSLTVYSPANPDAGILEMYEGQFTINRCEDILAAIGGSTTVCTSGPEGGPPTTEFESFSTLCFYYNTYCNAAGPNPWSCTNSQCVYTAPCSTASTGSYGPLVGGCPTRSRYGSLAGACNTTSGTCAAGSCATDSDCVGKTVVDTTVGVNGALCRGPDGGVGDCSCYKSSCVFKCSKDIDCYTGQTCDSTTSLCKQAVCQANADCIQALSNPKAQCVSGACKAACSVDSDCSGFSGASTQVCSAGFCTIAGCSSNADCTGGSAPLCVTAPATTALHTAVTN